jgi:hypothetical protein
MIKNELGLSMDNVKKEGIKIEVNQKDIIDMLVQEKIEQIELEVKSIREDAKLLEKEAKTFYDAEINKHVEIPKLKTKGLICSFHTFNTSSGRISYDRNSEILFIEISDYKTGFKLRENDTFIGNYKKIYGYTLIYSYTIEDITFSKTVPVNIPEVTINLCPKITAKIQKHNERVIKMLDDHSGLISESSITKKLKTTFTKEILKTTSASFQKKLSANFGVKL